MHTNAGYQREHSITTACRLLILVGLAFGLMASTTATAAAQVDRVEEQRTDHRLAPTIETLRLACSPDIVNGERGVLCVWSEAENPQTRGYKLFRIVDGSPRQLVATVGADGRLGHFDTDVSAPSVLVYGVISVNGNGRLIGRSAPVRVHYGQDIEAMRMACAPDIVGDQRGVLCRWSESSHHGVRGYVVYRISGTDQREPIARVGLDGRTAHFDIDVSPGDTLTYAVTAVGSTGTVLGIGGPVQITWPAGG